MSQRPSVTELRTCPRHRVMGHRAACLEEVPTQLPGAREGAHGSRGRGRGGRREPLTEELVHPDPERGGCSQKRARRH